MTTQFNYDPYFDDFDEDNNFMRVLFRPEYGVQARELTQLQTILSNQIEKFGNHIFKSGSPVIGGKISLDDTANYLILNTQYNNIDIEVTDFLGKTVISYVGTQSVRAKVIAVDTSTGSPILILKYLSGNKFAADDEIKLYGQNIFAKVAPLTSTVTPYGRSYMASLQEGVYYFKGQFVKVTPQFLIVELFHRIGYGTATINKKPSYKIGIEFDDLVIDEIDNTTLLDPAQGAFNYQAPGANRYKVATYLSKRTIDSSDQSTFFEILRLVDGVKTKEIDYPIYSEIEKMLARRTYDESGNYTVDPFVISLEEGDSANGTFNAILDPGKAYVGGYDFQTVAPTTIEVNRARQTATVSDYDIPTNYSSSIVLDTVQGLLDIPTFPELDIHCVPIANINVSTTNGYTSTKIGSLKASHIRYNDATNSDIGTTHSFTVNVFDVNSTPITGTTQSSGSSNTVIKFPTNFSSSMGDNAYANMYFRITDAGGAGIAPIRIINSSASSKTITLESALPFIPASNTFSIDSDFKVAKAVINRTGASINFAGNLNSDSKDASGFSYINEPTRSSLIFDLPYEAIKGGTITNMDLYARKIYSNKVSGGDGIITINTEGTDTFPFAGTPGVISDSLILPNIICMIRPDSASNLTSGITPNTALSLANNYFSVTALSSTSIQINLNTPSVRADFIIKSKINNSELSSTGAIRGKQMIPLTNGADLHAKVPYEFGGANTLESSNTGVTTVVSSIGTVYQDIGGTYFDQVASLTDLKTPGKVVSLQVPDVYEIIRITDSKSLYANVTTAMLTNSAYDVTDYYEFNNGQKKTHYDHATIKLKRGYSSPTGKIYVQYRYFKHISAPSPQIDGFFTVDSYLKTGSNVSYDEISKFTNKEDSKLTSLRSAFDFRPTRAIGGSSLSGAVNPDPDSVITSSFEYYMSRIDQLVVKPSREFSIIEGKSAVSPTPPPIGDNDMLIYTINIPAYTESVKEIRVDFKNNRRYTMQDIGAFENRIKQLEYYVSLSTLEKNTASTKVLDANGLERSKYGILVDNFTTTDTQATYTDVGYDNRCLIGNSQLTPASLMRTFKLKLIESACSGSFKIVGTNEKKLLIVNYSTTQFAAQPYATKSVGVASALFANFLGTMKLFPEFSGDVDTGKTARVTLNSMQGMEGAFNFINDAFKYISDKNKKWADDKDSPFAKTIDSKWYQTKHIDTTQKNVVLKKGHIFRGGSGVSIFGNTQTSGDEVWLSQGAELQQKQLTTSSSEVETGTFVTDLAIQPYIKPRQLLFNAQGLRPNSTYYNFFDGVRVDNFVVVPNKVTLSVSTGFNSGEKILIGTSHGDLVSQYSEYVTGGDAFTLATISNHEVGSTSAFIVNETTSTLSGKYILGLDSGIEATINSVDSHKSGVGTLSGSSLVLTSEASATDSYYNGQTIYIVRKLGSEDGVGETYTISSYVGSTRTATLSGASTITGSVTYSIGVNRSNDLGQVSGAFYPPIATFRTGERKYRVTESFNDTYDTDAISFAEHTYVSSGIKVDKTTLVDTVYNVGTATKVVGTTASPQLISSSVKTRVTASWVVDPLAQTFYVDPQVYPNGMFLSSVDLFFKGKDDSNLPVWIQIRPTVNGAPHTDFWYPESVITKYPSQVNISDNPVVSDNSTKTTFNFDTPIFLKSGLYALVVLTDSPEYSLWVAEKGKTTIRNEFVAVNPYVGTLYKSQNSMEYVPFINEDMMFVMNRCVFNTGTASFSLQSEGQSMSYFMDKFRVIQTAIDTLSNAPVTVEHSFISRPVGGSLETSYRAISPYVEYSMGDDDYYSIGYRRKQISDQGDFTLKISMSTDDNAITPVVSLESLYLNAWENFIDNASISSSDFNIIAHGSHYSNTDTITVNSTSGSGSDIKLVVDGPNGNVVGINVISGGGSYLDDYDITINTSTGTGASIVLNSEYDSSGGPCNARYITKPVTLADGFDAGDLRVFLSANKQGNARIDVFFKMLASSDNTDFKDRPYQKMECINPTTTPSQTAYDFREYEYRPSATLNAVTYTSTDGVVHDTFKTFAIKIIMTSDDETIIPRVKDLRIIALPAE